jgi:hypothetical protein
MKRCFLLMFIFLFFGFLSTANAITIVSNTVEQAASSQIGNLGQSGVESLLGLSPNSLSLLYKSEADKAIAEGPYSSSYVTTFSANGLNAFINYNEGTPYISGYGLLYLEVKDGDQGTIVFNLNNLFGDATKWNGTDTISIYDLWSPSRQISHVVIWGGAQVPEPSTILLLGAFLVGLAGVSRKRMIK